jgi:uncharacterized lipoprotein
MTVVRSSLRPLLLGVVAVALLSQTGCVWMRAKFGNNAVYKDSVQSDPLEVPPGMDAPSTSGATTIPDVGADAIAAAAAAEADFAARVPTAPGTVAVAGISDFTLTDNVESAWRRVGIALAKIDGVGVGESSQLLHGHEVTYQGVTMLIRAESIGGQTRVAAIGSDGQQITSGPATQLLALLKARLG